MFKSVLIVEYEIADNIAHALRMMFDALTKKRS